jgi:hypothetical protein
VLLKQLRKKAMSNNSDGKTYEVGYRKPPKHTQFKRGESGNPAGRPKGTRNLSTDLADELAERIAINEGGRKLSVSKQRAMVKQMMAKALRGEVRAASLIIGLVERLFEMPADTEASAAVRDQDKAIVSDFLRRHGITEQVLTDALASIRPADPESDR